MHMLLNVLPILDSLSRSFQLENVFICTLKPRVTGERQGLTVLRDELGEENFKHEEFAAAEHIFKAEHTFKQNLLFTAPANVQVYEMTCRNFIINLQLRKSISQVKLDVCLPSPLTSMRNYPLADPMLCNHGNEATLCSWRICKTSFCSSST